jgi:hypothetical protein
VVFAEMPLATGRTKAAMPKKEIFIFMNGAICGNNQRYCPRGHGWKVSQPRYGTRAVGVLAHFARDVLLCLFEAVKISPTRVVLFWKYPEWGR